MKLARKKLLVGISIVSMLLNVTGLPVWADDFEPDMYAESVMATSVDVSEEDLNTEVESNPAEELVVSNEDESTAGEDVGESIQNVIEASRELSASSSEELAVLQQQIEEIRNQYEELPEEKREVLDESKEILENASDAIDSMKNAVDEFESSGVIPYVEQSEENMNSFRFLKGQLIDEAAQIAEQETNAVVALENGEDEAVVQAIKDGEASPVLADASVFSGETETLLLSNTVTWETHGNYAAKKGIDVSQWQGNIDWNQVKNSGIEYAILRCGYGDNDASQDDTQFIRNAQECERLGIPYGVYLFSYALKDSQINSEVQHVLRLLQGRRISLPVYLDIEWDKQVLLGPSTLSRFAINFCNQIQVAGYTPGIYSSTYWWNNYLYGFAHSTDFTKWVAQYHSRVTYEGTYTQWQYSSKGSVPGISGNVDMDYWYGNYSANEEPVLQYRSHVADIGWQNGWSNSGSICGTVGRAKALEAFQIQEIGDDSLNVHYQAHVKDYGWLSEVSDGQTAGTTGKAKQVEAIRMYLTGADADKYDIYYCAHVANFGWMNWAKNGEYAGSAGYSYRMEAFVARILPKGSAAPANMGWQTSAYAASKVSYQTHLQDYGWQSVVKDGALSGTTGKAKRLEGIKISIPNLNGGIQYRTHVQDYGWENGWKSNGQMSGTSGKAKRLEAIQIQLTGDAANRYDVYYQTHIQNFGWSGWAKNGESCGSQGYAYRLEGIKIVLVPKGGAAPGNTNHCFYLR